MSKALMLFIVVAIGAGHLPGTVASAAVCSCGTRRTPAEASQDATAIFAGRVVEFDPPDYHRVRDVTVTFAVAQIWKGPAEHSLRVTTASHEPSCGYTFEEGREYLVYAHGPAWGLTTGLCSRTQPIDEAAADLQVLGRAVEIPPRAGPAATADDSDGFIAKAVWVAALGVLIVAVLWTGRRLVRRPEQ